MLPDDRLNFLKKRFLTDLSFKNFPRCYKQYVQAAIRMSKQLCYMGYYSDSRVYKSVGYIPFSERKDIDQRKKQFPENHSQSESLHVMDEPGIKTDEITADVVIVGSGAGASILGSQLVQLGRKVLLVER